MVKIKVDKSIKCNGEKSLFITFPYDERLVDIMRTFSTRYWHKENKMWEIPYNQLDAMKTKLNGFAYEISNDIVYTPEVKKSIDYKFKTKPFQYQIDGFNYGLSHKKWLLGDEQGLGKTKQVIDIACALKSERGFKHCLIICGVNGLKWNWQEEVKKHSDEQSHILGKRVRKNGKVIIGSNEDKLKDIQNIDSLPYFIITNVETLRARKDTGKTRITRNGKVEKVYVYPISEQIQALCNEGVINMIAFDEIHKCKSVESEQGIQLLQLNPEIKIAMTGTPLMNTPLDLYMILKWLDYEKHSFWSFKHHYCEMGGYGGYEILGYKNLDELSENLNSLMLRRLKENTLDLPEKIYINEYVEMDAKQSAIYKSVYNETLADLENIKACSNPLTKLIRLRQATGAPGLLTSKKIDNCKLNRLDELAEEATSNGRSVVVFSNWTTVVNEIYDLFKAKYRVGVITGETKDELRQITVTDFQNGKCNVLIGTTGAMGTGLTLTAGSVVIFVDEPWNKANKVQAEDRCHRVGQTQALTIYTLMCKDTIDERIHQLVEEKGGLSDEIVDNKVSYNKSELVDYLLS